MQVQVRIVVFTFVFVFAFSLAYSVFVWWKSRPIKPQPLPLKVVKWTSAIEFERVCPVDLDGDGRTELLAQDRQKRTWWARWTGKQPSFEPVPIPSGDLAYLPNWPESPAKLIALLENNRIWLVTRFGNTWEKVCIPVKVIPPMDCLFDLDCDGEVNDAVILREPKRIEWWRREKNGKIKLHDSLNLPKPYEFVNLGGTTWRQCELIPPLGEHGFISVKHGKLCWRESFAKFVCWMNADIDGDGKKDHIEQWKWRNGRRELVIQFTGGGLKVLALPSEGSVLVDDFDADGKSEILVRESTTDDRVRLTMWQYDRERDMWINKSKELVLAWYYIISPNAPFPEGSIAMDKTEGDKRSLLISVIHGDHIRLERWSWVGKDWQSQLIATLPELEAKEGNVFVIWIESGLAIVEERNPTSWLKDFHYLVREALDLIGFKSLSKRPIPFPPSQIWGWDFQRHRWLLLGCAFADERERRQWIVTPFGNKGELAIVWWSLPKSVNVGRFKNGVWEAIRLTETLEFEATKTTVLWDGKRYWTVLHDGKNFVAFTAD
jgi:hypothetical protein